jgi:hypothetical protein
MSNETCQLTPPYPGCLWDHQEASTYTLFLDNVELPPVQPPRITKTFQNSQYSTYSHQEAWDMGNIAQYHSRTLIGQRRVAYQFLFPTLTCTECCFPHSNLLNRIGDHDYVLSNQNTTQWYNSDFISAFSSLAMHYVHQSMSQRLVYLPKVNIKTLLHVTYPRQQLQLGDYKSLPLYVCCIAQKQQLRGDGD